MSGIMDIKSEALCATFDMLISMITKLDEKLDVLSTDFFKQAVQVEERLAKMTSQNRHNIAMHAAMVEDGTLNRVDKLDSDIEVRMDKLTGNVTNLTAAFAASMHGRKRKTK